MVTAMAILPTLKCISLLDKLVHTSICFSCYFLFATPMTMRSNTIYDDLHETHSNSQYCNCVRSSVSNSANVCFFFPNDLNNFIVVFFFRQTILIECFDEDIQLSWLDQCLPSIYTRTVSLILNQRIGPTVSSSMVNTRPFDYLPISCSSSISSHKVR